MKWRYKLTLLYSGIFTVSFIMMILIHYYLRQHHLYFPFLFAFWILTVFSIYFCTLIMTQKTEMLTSKIENILRNQKPNKQNIKSKCEVDILSDGLQFLISELEFGENVRNRLIGDVAHELRTPLTILRGQIEVMTEGTIPLKKENLFPLLDEITRMSKLLQDLQQLNLAESGQLQLERSWISIQSLIDEIVSVIGVEAEEKGIQLLRQGTSEQEIYCDRQRMKQVLINLIGNAIKYTPSGSVVKVILIQLEGEVFIDVSDNGPGIPPEHIPYLFKRFYRVEGSRNRQSGGTGLGLAIAKEFVEAHGGKLTVTSRSGNGSTFSIQLPCFPES